MSGKIQTPYSKEQFLNEIKNIDFGVRAEALGKLRHSKELTKPNSIADLLDILKDLALNDPSEKVRGLAARLCIRFHVTDNGINILPEQSEADIQLPTNIVNIMENVFKTAKVGHATPFLNIAHVKNIRKAFIALYPNEYTIIRNKYPTKTKYEQWLKERLAVYHKKCLKENEAKIKSGESIEKAEYSFVNELEILKKKANYDEFPGDVLPVNYYRLPPVPINDIRKCASYGFKIVASKETRLYQIRNAASGEVIVGNDFKMCPHDIDDFVKDYGLKHPLMLPEKLLGLYFPDLNVRLDSTYKKVGEGHKIRDYVDMFKKQHSKAVKEYMIGWCGKNDNGRRNSGIDHSLCLIFDQYLKNIGAKQ